MTEENYEYRTSQLMLRNQFEGDGNFEIPVIPKASFTEDDFRELLLIGFDRSRADDEKHIDRMVHFFLYDYKFERVWKEPDRDLERLRRYRAVLSPDFSMYLEMNPTMQLYNTFRNRCCGAYWASKGIRVVPTVNWGDESTFDFCFRGIEKGSVVAVSTYMATAHDNHADQKAWFLAGYREMLRRIQPEKIICYNTPFPEMEGDIVFVDYELSSWKYMAYEPKEDLDCYKIGGAKPQYCDIMEPYRIGKGGGSAYGGDWQPSPDKPEDGRFIGKPGEIKSTTMKNGEKFQTKIGPDGRASMERHNTDHGKPWAHTNPHDHEIEWVDPPGYPHPLPPINYPDGAPEFKNYDWRCDMDKHVQNNKRMPNQFETLSDFKNCIKRHGEVLLRWKGKEYSITHYNNQISISQPYRQDTERMFNTAEELLACFIDGVTLRDIIRQAEIIYRTI